MGGAARSRLVDARCDAAREEERPPSRPFWKRLEEGWSQERGGAQGGAKGGALRYKRGGRGGFAVRFLVRVGLLFLQGLLLLVVPVPFPCASLLILKALASLSILRACCSCQAF